MSAFLWQGGLAYSPPIELDGLGGVVMEVAVWPPLAADARIDVEESADKSGWFTHPMPASAVQEWTVHLLEEREGGFVRLRLDSGEQDKTPRRVRFWVRRSDRGPGTGREGGAS